MGDLYRLFPCLCPLGKAVKLSTSYATIKAENRFWGDIIRGESNQTIVLDLAGEVFFTTMDLDQPAPVLDILRKELPAVLSNETHKFFKNIDGTLYSFISRRIIFSCICHPGEAVPEHPECLHGKSNYRI